MPAGEWPLRPARILEDRVSQGIWRRRVGFQPPEAAPDSFISPEGIYSGVVDNHDGSFCTAAVLQRKEFVIGRTLFR